MKAALFSVFALALSAIASPVLPADNALNRVGQVKDVVKATTGTATRKVAARQVVAEAAPSKRAVADIQVVITTLKDCVREVNGYTTGINEIVEKVKSGAITVEVAVTQVIPIFKAIHAELTVIVTKLTGAVDINVDVDVSVVVDVVVALVTDVVTTVNTVVAVIGLHPDLVSILQSLFDVLASVLRLIIGVVGTIVPGLIAALTPLLAIGSGLLAPVLGPVTTLVYGLGI